MTDDPRRRPRRGGDDSRARKRGGSARPSRADGSTRSSRTSAPKKSKKTSSRTTGSAATKRPGAAKRRPDAAKKQPTGKKRPAAGSSRRSAPTGKTAQARRNRRMTGEQMRARRLAAMKEARQREARRRRLFRIIAWMFLIGILVAAGVFVRAKFHEHQQNLIEAQGVKQEEVVACTPKMMDISMERDGSVAGQPITFNISLKNTSDSACFLKVGTERMVLTVTSGEDHIWASHECREPQPDMRVFRPGVSTTIPITWDGSRTDSSCQDLPAPRPGVYVVNGTLNGKNVPALRDAFELTGPHGERVEQPAKPEDADSEGTDPADGGAEEGGDGQDADQPAEQPAPDDGGDGQQDEQSQQEQPGE